ncbi:hypothetical protein [Flexivirga alba]|uniref:Uncharacterized protein n=1 Tax=Flexivirga alba TaxID=702742 RepID=A0ABW2AG24_9MICO
MPKGTVTPERRWAEVVEQTVGDADVGAVEPGAATPPLPDELQPVSVTAAAHAAMARRARGRDRELRV